jgi:hypothetical protein
MWWEAQRNLAMGLWSLSRGIGDVVFIDKTGEKIRLIGVLFIPQLKNSIISLGPLD